MYLKSLTLQGFKSFADKVHLDFEPGIAAIVGPNGSGKSNISDALLWVFGERNAKHLRGQAMEDLIFSGSKTRKASQVAEVSLVLDNRDAALALDFDEIALTRRVYRTGESEYRINGSLVRRVDVLDVLHDAGFGISSQSIISQGALDRILHSKPEELCVLVEEAAGILKHKQRKLKSQDKIEGIQASLLRINDIAREIKRQLAPLEKKAIKALEFKKLSSYNHELDLGVALDDLKKSKARWQECKNLEERHSSSIEGLQQELKMLNNEQDVLTDNLQKKTVEQGQAERRVRNCALMLEKMDGLVRIVADRTRAAKQSLGQKEYALEQSSEQLNFVAAELERDKQACAEKQQALDEKNNLCAKREAELQESSDAMRLIEREISSYKSEQRDTRFQQEQLGRDLSRVQESENKKQAESMLIKARQEQLQKIIEEHAQELECAEKRTADLEDQVSALKMEEAKARELVLEHTEAQRGLESELEALQEKKAQVQGRVSSLEELERVRLEGNPLQQSVMKRYKHLKRVLDVVEVPSNLAYVIELYLASSIDALLIDTPDFAAYLEGMAQDDKGRAGSVYFATNPKGSYSHERSWGDSLLKTMQSALPPHLQSSVMPLLEYLQVDEAHEEVVHPLFEACFVVNSALDALQIHKHLKARSCDVNILVPEGIIFKHDGRIQVSPYMSKTTPQLFERKEERLRLAKDVQKLEDEQRDIQDKKRDCNNKLQELQMRLMEITQSKSEQEGLLTSSRTMFDQLKEKLTQAQKELESLNFTAKGLLEDLSDHTQHKTFIAQELESCNNRARELKDAIGEAYGKLNPLQEAYEKLKESLNALKLERVTLQEALRYVQHSREVKEKSLEQFNLETQTLMRETALLEQIIKNTQPFEILFKNILEHMMQTLSNLEGGLSSSQGLFASYNESIARLRSKIQEVQSTLDKNTNSLSEIRVELAKLEMQSQNICTHIEDDLNVALEQALAMTFDKSPEEMRANRKSVHEQIKALGTVNLDAAQEYEMLKLRNDYLESQLSDVQEAKAALRNIVRSLDERMEQDFQATYKQAQERFSHIFSLLFPGGQAVLELTERSNKARARDIRRGIEVIAQPAGKRITKMSLMSGGEKSLVALALLFALYGIRKAPFYVLDEVEAALDDMNLRRLLKYLDSLRQETQLIMITHQRRTMEMADVLYGVSMQDNGITRVISQKLANNNVAAAQETVQ